MRRMKNWQLRTFFIMFCAVILLFSLGSLIRHTLADNTLTPEAKIEPLVLQQMRAEGTADFFIWMTQKANLAEAYSLPSKEARGVFVFNTLRQTAESSQKAVLDYLSQAGLTYQSFYIANKIYVSGGTESLVLQLAARSDIAKITANHQFQLEEPFVILNAPEAVGSNVTFINADDVWAMGYNGAGMVLAGNDTGLDWDHPAIINHYRGWNGSTADHNYSWWDATGTYPTIPNDGHGHGTHTSGTMVGDDGGTNQIGVAPGAKTIHCKNMTNGGSGTDLTFTTCFQWDLAPWNLSGNSPDPSKAPHAVNNSWGYWGGNSPQFEDEVAALRAAGIVVEVSAGNEGPGCQTLRSPGDYSQSLTTGSVNHAGGSLPGTITGFSSRGASDLYPGDFIPDVMAPGENIRSSLPGGTYANWSGTSMAGPHTAALIALMWDAAPSLIGNVAMTEQIIKNTAVRLTGQNGSNCGGNYTTGPNNDWGYGSINALAAVNEAIGSGGPTPTPGPTATPTATPPPSGNTGFLSPSANAPVTSNAGDNNGFEVNPNNGHANDGLFAVDNNSGSNNNSSCTNNRKDKHIYRDYSVSLPGGAVVDGIEVRLDGRVDNTTGSPKFCVQLSWDGGTTWTTAKSTATLSTSELTYILGGTADTWGRTWAVSDFTNANFRVRIINVAASTARDFSLDWVAVQVTYH